MRRSVTATGFVALAAGLIGVALLVANARDVNSAPVRNTHSQALYTVELPAAWNLALDDEPTGSQLESIWRDPTSPGSVIRIYAVVPAERVAPIKSAESISAKVRRSPSHHEHSLKAISLDGRPAARWELSTSADRRVVYFFNQCEVGIKLIGSASPAKFASQAKTFRKAASSVSVRCP